MIRLIPQKCECCETAAAAYRLESKSMFLCLQCARTTLHWFMTHKLHGPIATDIAGGLGERMDDGSFRVWFPTNSSIVSSSESYYYPDSGFISGFERQTGKVLNESRNLFDDALDLLD